MESRKPSAIPMNTAQLITNGDNQTVILPKGFQLQGNEVYIKKIGNAKS
jgi:antitoxin VapB